MMILVSIFIAGIAFAIKTPLLKIFGATPETMEYAQDYLNIILAGTLFQVVGFSLNNVIRAEGNARVAMYSMLISAGINVILDPIFIFGFGLGVKGAAYATIISMFVMCIWVVLHFVQKRSTVALRLRYIRIDWKVIATIVSIGMAPFAMQLASSLVQGILNTQLIQFGGDIAVAANGILMSIMNMVFMTIVAVNMAIQPIIGFNYGARNFARVKDTLIKGIWIATAISIGAEIAIHIFPGFLVMLFNANDAELYHIGVRSLHLGMAATSIIGFQVIVGNYFQSTGKARMAMLLSLLRQVIFLIPLILILPSFFDLDGVWLSLPVAGAISAFVVFYYFKKEIKKLNEYIASRELLQ
jgi:putative MATE family efflux protein